MTAPVTSFMASDAALTGSDSAFLQMALDVLDDDDRVVHDQAGGERNAEQRQRVDGEAEQLDECEGADERDRNRDRGNDGGAPVFEKNKYHQDDQGNRRAQGRDNVADGFADGIGGIEGYFILHAGRKVLGKARKFDETAAVNVEGVGGGKLGDAEAHRVVPVVIKVGAVVFSAPNSA